MTNIDRTTKIVGIFLIAVGAIFLLFNLIPGMDMGKTWFLIFYFLAAGFCLPWLVLPEYRRPLAALFIPAGVLFALALIFTYNVLSDDFAAWAYAWLLIPAGVGLGLMLASLAGQWGRGARATGLWLMAVDVGLFALFASIFGHSDFIKLAGPVLIIFAGALILFRVFRR